MISGKEFFRDSEFIPYIRRFLRSQGFCCDAYKPSYLQRRILVRLRANQFKSYGDYYKYLRRNPKELKKLLDALTINVTGFFRDTDVYQFFQEQVLPEFLPSIEEGGGIRIWSAGCATGEEPYSIAMLMLDALGSGNVGSKITIFATDIDERSLETAKRGQYSPERAKNLSTDMINKFFSDHENYHVRDDIKTVIKFKRLDLLADKGIKLCDVIFCRNVLIYFNRADQEKILDMFSMCLKPRGYLILGKTEILPFGFSDKFSCVDIKAHVYRKGIVSNAEQA